MNGPSLSARVREVTPLLPSLKRFVLEPVGEPFPVAAAGAHVVVHLPDGGTTHRRAYTLAEIAPDRRTVAIIVRHVAASRGGSAFLHRAVRAGDMLAMSWPRNLFPVSRVARAHLLLSAGVGLTPFLAYLPQILADKGPVRLHQFCRPDEARVFAALLAAYAPHAVVHSGLDKPALRTLLAGQPLGTHVSLCGPDPFMAAATAAARASGFPPSKIHRERFAGAAPGMAFTVRLARDGRVLAVGADTSLLEALEDAGLDPPSLCRGGVCGQCRIGVLAGRPEHRCHVLSPGERAAAGTIMTCVSRGVGELVLDL